MIKNPFTYSYNYKNILDKSNSKSNLNLSNSNKGNIIADALAGGKAIIPEEKEEWR